MAAVHVSPFDRQLEFRTQQMQQEAEARRSRRSRGSVFSILVGLLTVYLLLLMVLFFAPLVPLFFLICGMLIGLRYAYGISAVLCDLYNKQRVPLLAATPDGRLAMLWLLCRVVLYRIGMVYGAAQILRSLCLFFFVVGSLFGVLMILNAGLEESWQGAFTSGMGQFFGGLILIPVFVYTDMVQALVLAALFSLLISSDAPARFRGRTATLCLLLAVQVSSYLLGLWVVSRLSILIVLEHLLAHLLVASGGFIVFYSWRELLLWGGLRLVAIRLNADKDERKRMIER